ncbi:hypothetical protein VTL71DRAFT_5488 [Oculimacula yallundae]|uniref:Uncharacterized protein n=1 Tax=Oculimacula yallundae TaxID=86028 RepID=A0ABR4C3R1_9HELO
MAVEVREVTGGGGMKQPDVAIGWWLAQYWRTIADMKAEFCDNKETRSRESILLLKERLVAPEVEYVWVDVEVAGADADRCSREKIKREAGGLKQDGL